MGEIPAVGAGPAEQGHLGQEPLGRQIGARPRCCPHPLINISGEAPGGAAEEIKKATISKLLENFGKSLRLADAQRAFKEYEWMPVYKAGSETWAGQVRVGHIEEATQLHSHLHGSVTARLLMVCPMWATKNIGPASKRREDPWGHRGVDAVDAVEGPSFAAKVGVCVS